MLYDDFNITIGRRNRNVYPVRAEHRCDLDTQNPIALGEADGILKLDPYSKEIRDKLDRLERRETDGEFLKNFGALLYSRLFTEDIERLYSKCSTLVDREQVAAIRIKLNIEPPEIAALPWEFLYSQVETRFIGVSVSSPLVRHQALKKPIAPLKVKRLPLKVLVIIPDVLELDTESEKKGLQHALSKLTQKGLVQLEFLEGVVSCRRIHKEIDAMYHCVYFIGHGFFSAEKEESYLCLHNEDGQSDYVNGERFAELFLNQDSIKLIVLNACEGAKSMGSYRSSNIANSSLTGVAPHLIWAGIPAVVAMQYEIYDKVARVFAEDFARVLFDSGDLGRVDVAMNKARHGLTVAFPEERAVGTPVLFMRTFNGLLFNMETGNILRDNFYLPKDFERALLIDRTLDDDKKILAEQHAISPDSQTEKALQQAQKDCDDHARKMKFRNVTLASVFSISVLMFLLLWVGLLFPLEARIDTYTMLVGNYFAKPADFQRLAIIHLDEYQLTQEAFETLSLDISENVLEALQGLKDRRFFDSNDFLHAVTERLEVIDPPKDRRLLPLVLKHAFQKPTRQEFGTLVTKLSQAGAKVIVFDMCFDREGEKHFNTAFTDAISQAKAAVVIGACKFDGVRHKQAHMFEGLETVISGVGNRFIGGKSYVTRKGYAFLAPLAILNDDKKSMRLSSLSLEALRVYALGSSDAHDLLEDMHITLINEKGGISVEFSEIDTLRKATDNEKKHEENAILVKGDSVANLFIDLTTEEPPHQWKYAYREISDKSAQELKQELNSPIVFIGWEADDKFSSVIFGKEYSGLELQAYALNTLLNKRVIRYVGKGTLFSIMTCMGLLGACLKHWIPKSAKNSTVLRIAAFWGIISLYLSISILVYISSYYLLHNFYHIGAFVFTYWITGKLERKYFPKS